MSAFVANWLSVWHLLRGPKRWKSLGLILPAGLVRD